MWPWQAGLQPVKCEVLMLFNTNFCLTASEQAKFNDEMLMIKQVTVTCYI